MGMRSLSKKEISNIIGQNVLFKVNFDDSASYVGELLEIVETDRDHYWDKNGFDVKIRVLSLNSFPAPGYTRFEGSWLANRPLPYGHIVTINRSYVERFRSNVEEYNTSYKSALNDLINNLNTYHSKLDGDELSDYEVFLDSRYKEDFEVQRALRGLVYIYNQEFEDKLTTPSYNTVGYRLLAARSRTHYTKEDVIELVDNLYVRLLTEIENDILDPSVNLLVEFSKIYDVSIEWILTGDEFRNKSEMNTIVVAEHWKGQAEMYEAKFNKLTNSIKSILEIVYEDEEDV